MPPKKSPFSNKNSFQKGYDPKRLKGRLDTELEDDPSRSRSRRLVRSPSLSHLRELEPSHIPAPLDTLRPRSQSVPPEPTPTTTENWIVDQDKLLESFNGAIKEHDAHAGKIKGKNKGHSAILQKLTDRRIGFGVVVRYRCGFSRCSFESSPFDLFQRMGDGGVETNLAAGTAMAKSDLTPSKVEFLSTVMNIKPPSRHTLQKNYNNALEVAEQLAELALAENRSLVYNMLEREGKVTPGTIPEVEASTDAQYSLRSYHTPTGTSQSASIPVIENETGAGLLIQHSSLSRRDGTLQTHINNAESQAATVNYEKTYKATEFPLALQTVTVDGDASIRKGFEKGVAAVGESRPFQNRACSQHGSKAAARKFIRESLKPLSKEQRLKLGEGGSKSLAEKPTVVDSNTCPQCQGIFKSARGVLVHQRSCKGPKSDSSFIGLESLFYVWSKTGNSLLSAEKKVFRNGVRVWLIGRIKSEFYRGLAQMNPDKKRVEDDNEIKSRLVAAGRSILGCIVGDHERCSSDSFVCWGDHEPASYASLPYGVALHDVPSSVLQWLSTIIDCMLSQDSLKATVVNGRSGTTSLVESVHHQIRKTVPKGQTHSRNETRLIKSGVHASARRGYPVATIEHLQSLNLTPSKMQLKRFQSLQRSKDNLRRLKKTKEYKVKLRAFKVNTAKVYLG